VYRGFKGYFSRGDDVSHDTMRPSRALNEDDDDVDDNIDVVDVTPTPAPTMAAAVILLACDKNIVLKRLEGSFGL